MRIVLQTGEECLRPMSYVYVLQKCWLGTRGPAPSFKLELVRLLDPSALALDHRSFAGNSINLANWNTCVTEDPSHQKTAGLVNI